MIEVHAEFPQREVIQANAVVDNEEKTVSEVIISAKPEITGVTASVDNETGTPYVDVTETGTGTDFSFDLAFHNLKGDKGEQGEQGEPGQDGQDGTDGTDGQDGFSPIATVEPIQDGAKITITDKDGTTTTNVYNGTDGTDGADGQAATVTVGTTTTGAAGTNASVVNSGTSSAAVFDFVIPRGDKGDTGNTGATGQDGFSPSASVSQSGGVTTISITDKNGTTTESIDLSSYATQTDLTNGLATKQDTLIAGTDLEIVNATTINFTNDSGYTTNEGTVTSVNNIQPDANGDVTLTIPTVNDGVLTITQNGTSKGTFNANQSTNNTIALTDTTYNAFTGADGTNAGSSGLVPAPSATDNDKYLKGDGTWASVSGGSSTDVQINGTSITSGGVANIVTNTAYNASSNKIATMSDLPSTSGFLENTATGSNSLTIIGNATSGTQNVNIGKGSTISASGGGVAVGYDATIGQNATNSTAIGHGASVTAAGSIQLGGGINSTPQSLAVGFTVNQTTSTYQLLNGTTGLIPDARISTNIQRTSTAVTHTANTAVGSSTKPVYISSTGAATASTSTVGGSSTPVYLNAGTITSTGLSIASSRFDGQWVQSYHGSLVTATSAGSSQASISTYLPSDSYDYEVMFYLTANYDSTACDVAIGNIASPLSNDCIRIKGRVRNTSASVFCTGIIPIKSSARIIYTQRGAKVNSFQVDMIAYRRIGTNS